MLKVPAISLETSVFLLIVLTVGGAQNDTGCRSRRCLAEMLIDYNLISQPQYEDCTVLLHVPHLEYQTVSVDTKSLHLNVRLVASLIWSDIGLSWNTSDYIYNSVVLPVQSIWTPKLHITNALESSTEDMSSDLLLYSNGTLVHSVIINGEVNCDINMFNYPFAADGCPIALKTWATDGCGTNPIYGEVKITDSSHGDWETQYAILEHGEEGQAFIYVYLKMNPTNPFIAFMLPSILIILADMISFALPLEGGERNGFKVTLVLSFTVFLSILNDQLPGNNNCSPIIRIHFCVCLVLLVLSMLVSLVLTRVATDGRLFFFQRKFPNKEERGDEVLGDISVVQLQGSEEDSRMLKRVVKILEDVSDKRSKSDGYERFAHNIDTVFFWCYLIFGTVYFCAMVHVMVKHTCLTNHFDFWYEFFTFN